MKSYLLNNIDNIRNMMVYGMKNGSKYSVLQIKLPETDDLGYIVIPLQGKKNLIQQPGYLDKLFDDFARNNINVVGISNDTKVVAALGWLCG